MQPTQGALEGRIVLITGAAGTLGKAIGHAVAAAGGRPIRSDLAGRPGIDLILDVTSEHAWVEAMAEIKRLHGRLDELVNNAGIVMLGDVEQTSLADWRRVQAVNVDGVFLGCKHAMPLLATSNAPAIVNLSSVSGLVGGANLAAMPRRVPCACSPSRWRYRAPAKVRPCVAIRCIRRLSPAT